MLAHLQEAFNVAAAAAATAVATIAFRAINAWWTNMLATRVTNAAGRAAGQIVEAIAQDPNVQAATTAMFESGVAYVRGAVPDAIRSLGVTPVTIEGIVRGELGRLLAPSVAGAVQPSLPAKGVL